MVKRHCRGTLGDLEDDFAELLDRTDSRFHVELKKRILKNIEKLAKDCVE